MKAGSLEIQLLLDVARLQKDMRDLQKAVGGAMGAVEKEALGMAWAERCC